jgi:hypothetical protein
MDGCSGADAVDPLHSVEQGLAVSAEKPVELLHDAVPGRMLSEDQLVPACTAINVLSAVRSSRLKSSTMLSCGVLGGILMILRSPP